MGNYSIKELERLSGIKAHTLRIWEKRYNLFEPNRSDTNIRFYSDSDLKKLLNVTILSNSGTKISKIVAMDDEQLKEAIAHIKDEDVIKQKRIDDLIFPMLQFNEEEINQLLKSYYDELGIEGTFTGVIYPFLEKIGILWLTDEVEPAQEHFMTHILRQKLSAAIESLPNNSEKLNRVLLFLPEGEYHELGLLFFAYLYKKRGVRVYYFGQSAPIKQIIQASKVIKPNWIMTYTVVRPKGGIQSLIDQLGECVSDETYFLVNRFQQDIDLKFPSNIRQITSYSDVI
ncbi:MerR family transcriptional regulator [Vicingaceae bacterium]|nr:MerR family transcriptional regulator [Vicingaceae bacterium]MDB4061300.1 MerR family transcriptional regulator [Vicingaceae bacterium]MDC1451914.1 MerR family transcriptional regulator [Vicingaceae bacterium]